MSSNSDGWYQPLVIRVHEIIEPDNANAQFDALHDHLSTVATGINLGDTKNLIATHRGPAIGAIRELKRHPETVRVEDDVRSSNAAETLRDGGGAFIRPYDEKVTDGDWGVVWKSSVKYTKDDLLLQTGDMIYDWRLGIPVLLEVISYRLQFIAAIDPNFRNNDGDDSYDGELEDYRSNLIDHLDKMLKGIKYGVAQPKGTALPSHYAACADIRTGIAAIEWGPRGGQPLPDPQAVLARLQGEVMRAMPLFEVRAMIDTLSLYIHGGPDLTEEASRIAVKAAPHLCLDVQWGNLALGTPVQLWDCNGGDAQKWTYDPETGVLQSALGTALDIRGGVMQAQTPVQTWSRHDGPAQQWVTGAYIVQGSILDKWTSLGGKTGFLGAPITDETPTPDGRGRFTHFQGSSIYWTPETGAHEVHGLIREKWAAMGWENGVVSAYGWTIGYPLTDETPTAYELGRVNDFEGASIYWHPDTGVYFVGGAIRDKWWELGAEQSPLGYPISDETSTGNGIERVSAFMGGWIFWDESRSAYEVYR